MSHTRLKAIALASTAGAEHAWHSMRDGIATASSTAPHEMIPDLF